MGAEGVALLCRLSGVADQPYGHADEELGQRFSPACWKRRPHHFAFARAPRRGLVAQGGNNPAAVLA